MSSCHRSTTPFERNYTPLPAASRLEPALQVQAPHWHKNCSTLSQRPNSSRCYVNGLNDRLNQQMCQPDSDKPRRREHKGKSKNGDPRGSCWHFSQPHQSCLSWSRPPSISPCLVGR